MNKIGLVERRSLLWFAVIVIGFSWPLFAVPLFLGDLSGVMAGVLTTVPWALAMWGPGLGALIATRYVLRQPLRTLNLHRLGAKRYYIWALLLPPVLSIFGGLLTVAFGVGEIDTTFSLIRETMASAPGATAVPPVIILIAQIGLALTLAPLFNTLFALGEELGWRGFLLPKLLPLGQWPAIIISGVVWGVWHAPAILQGLNYPGRPVLGIGMMIVFTVLLGAIFSWLYLKTGSPWAPALAHGAVNATGGLPILFMPDVNIIIGGTLSSAIGWIGLALFVVWLVASKRLPLGRAVSSQLDGTQEQATSA